MVSGRCLSSSFFYIFGILIVGMIVDSSSPILAQAAAKGTAGGASASPFVVAIQAAGIKGLPSVINGALLLFVISAAKWVGLVQSDAKQSNHIFDHNLWPLTVTAQTSTSPLELFTEWPKTVTLPESSPDARLEVFPTLPSSSPDASWPSPSLSHRVTPWLFSTTSSHQ